MTVNNLGDLDGLSEAILAVTTNRTGTTQIFVVDVLSGDAHNVSRDANSHNRYPMWSPDGLELVFTSDRSRPDTYNLYIVDSQGRKVRQLTDIPQHGVCYFPTWFGSYIYFGLDAGDGSPAVIARINEERFRLYGNWPGPRSCHLSFRRHHRLYPEGEHGVLRFLDECGRNGCSSADDARKQNRCCNSNLVTQWKEASLQR